MKKTQTKIRQGISKTSFQAQLFLIILAVFALFVVSEFFVIQYSFNRQYVNTEIQTYTDEEKALIASINMENDNTIPNVSKVLESFQSESGGTPVYISNAGGGFALMPSNEEVYYIRVDSGTGIYRIIMPSMGTSCAVGNLVSAYLLESTRDDYYTASTLSINGESIVEGVSSSGGVEISGSIIDIHLPSNLNYLYETNSNIINGLRLLSRNYAGFNMISDDNSRLSLRYHDEENNVLYILSQPNSEDSNVFILTAFSMMETSSLLSIVSSYYGYIVLVSILVAILIALFISRAFSGPIRTIEEEMKKLAEGNYDAISNKFNNKELVSLQNTVNFLKEEISTRVNDEKRQKEELAILNKDLQNQENLRTAFIQRLSHELKTPLMVISATVQAIRDGVIDPEEMDGEYQTILEEVDKTTDIIKKVVTTYRLSSQEIIPSFSRFNLTKLVKEELKAVYPLAEKKKIKIVEGLDQDVYMNADREQIGQVISNFLTNAIKYTKESEKIEVNIIDSYNNYVFEVKNYGAKIKEENLSNIWLPFFRENQNIEKESTGMGLYFVRETLNAHKIPFDVINTPDGAVRAFFVINK